ncbi:flagellar protein export ATPase FliI [Faunimonas sp. B44]|uniref:flagellar protein export ATPase FliI n=1 Tax=Faunimonas sp. B44 TaxID=3461493 RepID=UPI0040448500
MSALDRLAAASGPGRVPALRMSGVVTEVAPTHFRLAGLSHFLKLGDCIGAAEHGPEPIGEVVRIDDAGATVKPYANRLEVGPGTRAFRIGPLAIAPDIAWKGRVIDAICRPIDGDGPLVPGIEPRPVDAAPPPAIRRARAREPVATGVRAIDIFTPICRGQRVGIFAGSGVGKSTLLSMLAHARGFDSIVIALVGERGREVREFLEESLGPNRKRAVTVVATGDESAMMRRLAPRTAMTVAEALRDAGESVLLIVDSITRYAHAARDVALAAGEPAVARGYAPSVFGDLPRLLERAGPGEDGSGTITGIFAVLVDGDDLNEPVSDAIRGTLDGHIVLSRSIADQGRYPAVDILASVSRLAHHAWAPEQRGLVTKLKAMVASFEDSRDLRLMGGYHAGADPDLDQAVALVPALYRALVQEPSSPPALDPFRELADALQPGR